MTTPPPNHVLNRVDALAAAWCDRRCYVGLRHLLRAFPLISPLTDGWAELGIALANVRAFARDSITKEELQEVEDLIREVDRLVRRA